MAYIGTPVQQALTKVTSQSFNGTGSQTVFTLNRAVNVPEDLEVFVNNIQQEPGVGKSYTATGTTLTFDAAPSSGTGNIYVIYRGSAEVTRRLEHDPNAALAATTGTFSGDLTVDTNTLYVDSTNNRVGVGTTSPSAKLHLGGTAPLDSIIRQDSTVSGTNWEIGERAAGKWQIFEDDNDTVVATFQSNGKAGIGTSSPVSLLHLESDTPVITLRDTSAYSAGTGPYIQFQGLDSGSTNRVFGQIYGLSNGSNSGELAFYTRNSGSTAERLRIDSSGRVTKPYQVYFRASPNGGSYVTTSPIQFSVASANVGSAFNTGTSTFTAPVAGRYMFHLHLGVVRVSIAGSDVYPRFRVNGASREYSYYLSQSVTNYSNTNITAIYELNANDYLDVTIVCGGTSAYYNGSSECVLTGYLLG